MLLVEGVARFDRHRYLIFLLDFTISISPSLLLHQCSLASKPHIKNMTDTNGTKEPKRLVGRRRQRPENPIETANKIEDDEFLTQYVKPRLVYVFKYQTSPVKQ
jgi:hypothetical protein